MWLDGCPALSCLMAVSASLEGVAYTGQASVIPLLEMVSVIVSLCQLTSCCCILCLLMLSSLLLYGICLHRLRSANG